MPEAPEKIGPFTRYGKMYRSPGGVSLTEADARRVVEMSEAEALPVGTVLRRLVRKGLGRKVGSDLGTPK